MSEIDSKFTNNKTKENESPGSPTELQTTLDPKKASLKEIVKFSFQKFLNGFYVGYGSRSVLSLLVRIFSLLRGGKFKSIFTVEE